MTIKFAMATLVAMASVSAANAANLVTNGSFESSTYTSNTQFGSGFGGDGVTGWTGRGPDGYTSLQMYYIGGTQTTTNAVNIYGDPLAYFSTSFSALSPDGGNFVAFDADPTYHGAVSQTIDGLVVGKAYDLSFYWAGSQWLNRTGPTFEQIGVTFGNDTAATSIVNIGTHEFSGWQTAKFRFTATSASQLLTLFGNGGPGGLPPVAALDGVSLTAAVPDAATWVMLLAGFGLTGLVARRRRVTAAA